MPGDELLPDAVGLVTHDGIVDVPPGDVWPWLVRLGCRPPVWDLFDNGRIPCARDHPPEARGLKVGDLVPATPNGGERFEVLRVERDRVLVLGGLFDDDTGRQLPFASVRPERFWQVTWAFVLEPQGEHATHVYVRARAAYRPG